MTPDVSGFWRASPARFAVHLGALTERGEDPEYTWQPYRHLEALSEALLDLRRGKLLRLLVSMPPGHGKSLLTSVYTPVWWLDHDPRARILLSSATADLASYFSGEARDLAIEHADKLRFRVSESDRPKNWWFTTERGYMASAGIGGQTTGKRADLFIVDDPVKDMESALSETQRETAWQWFTSVAKTRLLKRGRILVVMTRWNEDDLGGRILAQQEAAKRDGTLDERFRWRVINWPAIAEENDELGREEGEPLCPELYDLPELEDRRRDGSYTFNALYQGRPSPVEGNLLKRHHLRWWSREGDTFTLGSGPDAIRCLWTDLVVFMTVDLAGSKKTTADLTCAQVWALLPRGEYPRLLLDQQLERLEGPDHLPMIASLAERWGAHMIGVEREQFGLSAIQAAKREGIMVGGRRVVLPIVELEADRSKLARFLPAAADAEQGRIYLPQHAPWVDDLVSDLTRFAGDGSIAHDDAVDAFSYSRVMAERCGDRTTHLNLAALGIANPDQAKRGVSWDDIDDVDIDYEHDDSAQLWPAGF